LKHAWAKGNDEFLLPGKPGIEVKPIKFSVRETEIIRLIAQGKRSREIVDEINISVFTLDQHKNHIRKKLNLDSARDILKYVLNHKIEWD
jgi:DNA-binding CsgD family transcriptional regulator